MKLWVFALFLGFMAEAGVNSQTHFIAEHFIVLFQGFLVIH